MSTLSSGATATRPGDGALVTEEEYRRFSLADNDGVWELNG